MIAVLRPVPAAADPGTRAPALFRQGISSARRELQSGTARRHRREVDSPPDRPARATDLAMQRAGVRAALAELRHRRGTA